MTVVRGVSIGGKVVGALRYAPVKAPALLRVIGLQGRQPWIPAFAGMTVKGRADQRRDAESSSEGR